MVDELAIARAKIQHGAVLREPTLQPRGYYGPELGLGRLLIGVEADPV
jgi:hypothetical protein